MIKRWILAFTLVMFSSCVVHAESSSKGNTHVRAKKKEVKKNEEKPVYLDMSTKDDDESSMPAITPKGKL